MPTVDVGGNDYLSYADVEYADIYLAADFERATKWTAATEENKGRGLVSATRLLQRQVWVAGSPPAVLDPGDSGYLDVLAQATSLLAADILADPTIASSGSTASNIKRVNGDGPEVEFFAPQSGTPLPSAAWDLLLRAGLIGGGSVVLGGSIISGDCYPSRFDPTDYRLARNW